MKSISEVGLILPEHQQNRRKSLVRALGYIFRSALALLCTYALTRFSFDCIGIRFANGAIFSVCVVVCAVFALILSSPRLFMGGTVTLLAAVALFVKLYGGFFESVYLAAVTLHNACCRRLGEMGHNAVLERVVDLSERQTELGLHEQELVWLALVLVILIFGAICSLFITRRARIVPLIGVKTALATLMFSLGVCEDSFGLSLMLASLCGVFTLYLYDNVYCKKKNISALLGTVCESPDLRRELDYTLRVNSSLGGFAGISAAIIALIITAVLMNVNEPMRDIPTVSNSAVKVENFLSAIVRGSGSDGVSSAFGGAASNNPRSTAAEKRIYSGQRMFEVQTDVKMPIYLRSWVGTDYVEDSWYTASQEQIEEFRAKFGGGFSHEYLNAELLRAIDPSLVAPPDDGAEPVEHLSLGYVTTYVHIDKKAPTASLLYLPSYTDQKTRLLAYGSRSNVNGCKYSNYYDGIFSSTDYVFVDDYTVLAHLQTLPSEATVMGIAALVEEYAVQYEVLCDMRVLARSGADDADIRAAYESFASAAEHEPSGSYAFARGKDSLSYRYAYAMDDAQRGEIDALMDNLSLYYEFVYDNYLTGCERFGDFERLVRKICAQDSEELQRSSQSYTGRHRIVTEVIDYLAKNTDYTLTPAQPSQWREYTNAAETFLFDTKEGYCVQYATAAVMLLRAAGIPARYAEGYIAHNFSATPKDSVAKYKTTVRDSNSHAWVEVYYDYYGWVPYETTSAYMSADTREDIIGADNTDTSDTTDTEKTDTTLSEITTHDIDIPTNVTDTDKLNEPSDEKSPSDVATGVVMAAISAAVLAILVILMVCRVKISEERRRKMISDANNAHTCKAKRCEAAVYIGDEIMRLLTLRKLTPRKGERASAFAARVDEAFGELDGCTFVRIMSVIQKAEFAHDVTQGEAELLTKYYAALYAAAQENAHPINKLCIKLCFSKRLR